MPEGDNIYKHAAALAARFVGKEVAALHVRGIPQPALAGVTVAGVEARGKHLLIALEGGTTVHVHLGIQGSLGVWPVSTVTAASFQRASLVLVVGAAAVVVRRAKLSALARTAFVQSDLRSASRAASVDSAASSSAVASAAPAASRAGLPAFSPFEPRLGLRALGPDLLDPAVDLEAVVARARQRGQHEPDLMVADLLLDQRVACGLGNVYKSEVLFLERVDPWALVGALPAEPLARLYVRAVELLRGNLGPWRRTTTANLARGEWVPRGRGRTNVYGRRGRPCYVCGAVIEARRQGPHARMTYFCRVCQKVALTPAAASGRPRVEPPRDGP